MYCTRTFVYYLAILVVNFNFSSRFNMNCKIYIRLIYPIVYFYQVNYIFYIHLKYDILNIKRPSWCNRTAVDIARCALSIKFVVVYSTSSPWGNKLSKFESGKQCVNNCKFTIVSVFKLVFKYINSGSKTFCV